MPDTAPEATSEIPSFRERLARLFDTIPDADGGRMSVRNLCASAAEHGHFVSVPYVYQLLQGKKANPSLSVVNAIAAGFGIDPKYFLDDQAAEDIDKQIHLLRLMRDPRVQNLWFRIGDMDNAGIDKIIAYVETLQSETPPPPPAPDTA